ncbi:MAG: endonuclease/exonuclease/phosphatase family protein [Alicyclobacillus herbarius]|uniref:endonuclease/exonuclease/phosphatase family protein n=1 Tax=Alicyclobacillus herbarius TaxID=122960 RepID=UPI00235218D4|nr:endonuclease/exonuclease/phosphatase family protein [Alicyclobacillus herbarius]MCL6632481.1 endonuclease/exonuclease/phosphatase family protein [Alicyclobacillus herbarius]
MRWRHTLLSTFTTAGMCLACLASPAWAAESPAAAKQFAPSALTFVSYNTHGGVGMDGKYDLQRIAKVIAQTHADVVGLQEVGAYWHEHAQEDDEAEFYSKRLHMYGFFAPIFDLDAHRPGDPRRRYGVLLLSRFPMHEVENHPIARRFTQHHQEIVAAKPGFAEAVMQIDGQDLHVYLTHLDYRRDPQVRERQVHDMMRIIAQDRGPKVLMGDLNATPSAPELQPLWRVFANALGKCSNPCMTFPADAPNRLIDYVLVSRGMEVKDAQVIDSQASDHRPVRVQLVLPAEKKENPSPA